MQRKRLGNEHRDIAAALYDLAVMLHEQGKLAEAEPVMREAVEINRKRLTGEHLLLARQIGTLGRILEGQRKYAEAEALFREAWAMSRKLQGSRRAEVIPWQWKLAGVMEKQGKLTEAETIQREALETARNLASRDPSQLEPRLSELAENLYRQSKFAEAESLSRELLESRKTRLGAEDNAVLGAIAGLARLLADWAWTERGPISDIKNQKSEVAERARKAERLMRDCLAVWLRGGGTNETQWTTGEFRSRLGGALLAEAVTDSALTSEARLAKFTEAESLLLEGNETLRQGEKVDSKLKRDALTRLVRHYQAWDKPDKATAWQQKLDDFNKAEAETRTEKKDASSGP